MGQRNNLELSFLELSILSVCKNNYLSVFKAPSFLILLALHFKMPPVMLWSPLNSGHLSWYIIYILVLLVRYFAFLKILNFIFFEFPLPVLLATLVK